MKIGIGDSQNMLYHFLLGDLEVADKVMETEKWKEDGEVVATVFMNGVEVPAESFEEILQKLWRQVEGHYAKEYDADAFDERVEKRARELLKEHADNAIEKLCDLTNKLHEAENILIPHWER